MFVSTGLQHRGADQAPALAAPAGPGLIENP